MKARFLDFLHAHLPQSDLDCYPESLWEGFVDHAVFLLETVPWCRDVEPEVFCHYVLFPRVNDEDLSPHRRLFFDALWPRVKDLSSPEERVLAVNRWCHEVASYQAQDARTASPLTVYRCGSGRCGEESAFLVAALRSVGIPARQVYAPRWSHCDDNHAWVEALCQDRWRFLGACEPEPVLDRGWFNTAAARALLVHARLFGDGASPLHGTPLGTDGPVGWYAQTDRYAQTRTRTFRVLHRGLPAAGAQLRLQVLNEAGFHTVATLTADENGVAQVALGLGDVHVLALWRGLWAEGDFSGDGELSLEAPPQAETDWTAFDFHAPAAPDRAAPLLNEAQRVRREAELERGNALRQARLAGFSRTGKPQWQDLLDRARGNASTIAAFLEQDADPLRLALVRSLSEKDLRDVSARVLEDHFQNAPPRGDLPWEVYVPWVLCPRVELEPLTPWRRFLGRVLPERPDPRDLRRLIDERTQPARTYSGLVWTPAACWRACRGDGRSRKLLLVAALRTRGVPARLRPLDGVPEYWRDGAFHTLEPEGTGLLRLTGDAGLVYRQSWSLSRRQDDSWQLLELPQSPGDTPLPAGYYRLLTTARLPGGSQFAARRDFPLAAGETRTETLVQRPLALGDLLRSQALAPMTGRTLSGQTRPLCPPGQVRTLLWLAPGEEPTEHLLNELLSDDAGLARAGRELVVLPRDRAALVHPTLARLLARQDQITVLLDDWAYDAEQVARQLTCEPGALPLAVVCDRAGRAVFATAGYRVGSVALLGQIAQYLENGGK